MTRAILRNGVIYPVDPLPDEWKDGQELWVDSQNPGNGEELAEKDLDELDKWYEKLNEMVSQNDPDDLLNVEAILAENDRIEKDRMRKVMGLS
jgi:hypothetical protein